MDLGVITPDLPVNLKEIEPTSLAGELLAAVSLHLGDLVVPQLLLPRSMAAQSYPQLTLAGSRLLVTDGLVNPDDLRPEPLQVFHALSNLDA